MTAAQQKRLADIRAAWLLASTEGDTRFWEATFFLQLLDEKNEEIRRLKKMLFELNNLA